MAKKTRKTNRRRKVSNAKEPESLALPDVDGDSSPVPADPVVIKKDPVLETLKKIEKNTEDTKKILKDGVGSSKKAAKDSSGRAERRIEADEAKAEKVQKAEEVAAKSYGDLFKENTGRAIRGFGRRVRRGVARLPEDLAERTIPGPLGRIIARTFKQKRVAKETLAKRDAEMAAKPASSVDGVGSEIYKNPPQVDFDNMEPNNQDAGSRAESIGESVAEKLDAIYEENRKTNFKLDKLIEFARGNNEIQEQQNALLEESQTEAERRGKQGATPTITRDDQGRERDGGGGGWLDWLLGADRRRRGGRGGFFGRVFGRRSKIGRMFRRTKIGLNRGFGAVKRGVGGLFKNVGQRSPILRGAKNLLRRGRSLLPVALGGIPASRGMSTPTPSAPTNAPKVPSNPATQAAKPGFFSRAWSKLSSAGKWVGEKASNLGLGKVLAIFKGGGGKMLRKLIKIPVIGAAIEAGLLAMDISAIKSDPTLTAAEKKKKIGETIASGLGSIIGGAIGAAGGAAIAGSLGLAGGPAALVTGALGAVAGGAAGSWIGEKIGGAIGSGIGGEEIYDILSSIPGVGSLIAVPDDETSMKVPQENNLKSDLGPSTGEEIPGTVPMEPVQYDENGYPYLRGTQTPAPVAPPSGSISAPTQNMMKTNDAIDQAASKPLKSASEQKNTVVNAPTNTTAMFAPMRVRDESIQMLANLNRVALA